MQNTARGNISSVADYNSARKREEQEGQHCASGMFNKELP